MVRFRLILLLGGAFLILPSYAQMPRWLLKNFMVRNYVVKVDSDLEAGDGFGFVIAKRADTFYVATAKHVVFDWKFSEGILVSFYEGRDSVIARGWRHSPAHDFAVLQVPTSGDNYLWPHRSTAFEAREGSKVGIIGKRRSWSPTPTRLRGRMTRVGADSIHSDLREIIRGCSGGPMLDRRGIVGMVISSNPNATGGAAIPIGLINEQMRQWWGVSEVKRRDIPYVQLGADLDISLGLVASNEPIRLVTSKELYGHVAVTPMIRVRYGWTFFKSHGTPGDTTRYDFRNRFGAHTLGLSYDFVKNVHPLTLSVNAGTYVITRTNPELKEGDDWIPFEDVTEYQGRERSLGWYAGATGELTFASGLAFHLDFGLKYFEDRYLITRPFDPLGQSQPRIMWLSMGLGASYKLGYWRGGRRPRLMR